MRYSEYYKRLKALDKIANKLDSLDDEQRELLTMQYAKRKFRMFYISGNQSQMLNSRDDCLAAFDSAIEKADDFVRQENLTYTSYDYYADGIRVFGYVPMVDDVLLMKLKRAAAKRQKLEAKKKAQLKQAHVSSKKEALEEIARLKKKYKL